MTGSDREGDLASLQRALAEALRAPAPLVLDAGASALAARIAAGNERLSPAMQLDIYREQFFLRHLDVLRDDFASLAHLLGDDAFDRLGSAYLQAFPPSSFTLRDLGHGMERFVAETAPWADDALLADLARVEWAFVEAFDAPEGARLDLAAVAAVPEDAWPRARIVLQPSLQRVKLGHAGHDYRLAVRNAGADAAAHAALVRPPPRPAAVIVYRGLERLACLEVDADAWTLLDELARATSLGEACERVAVASGTTDELFQERVGAWFQQWTALGWISSIG